MGLPYHIKVKIVNCFTEHSGEKKECCSLALRSNSHSFCLRIPILRMEPNNIILIGTIMLIHQSNIWSLLPQWIIF